MVRDQEKITNQSNKIISSGQLFNNNRLKALVKASFVNSVTNVITNTLDTKFVTKSKVIESEITESKVVKFDNNQNNLIATFLITKVDK